MTAVVTGATGFLGAALTRLLLKQGWTVIALMRSESQKDKLEKSDKLICVSYQTLSQKSLSDELAAYQPTHFFHFAWAGVGSNLRNQAEQFTYNIPLTLDSVQLAQQIGCTQWMATGSQAEYGLVSSAINEEHNCRPITAYGKAKLATSVAALGLCQTVGITGTWCRVFSIYGPGDHTQALLPYLIDQFHTGLSPELTPCEQLWDYLYIDDAVEAMLALATHDASGLYNIGSGIAEPLKATVEQLRMLFPGSPAPVYGAKGYAPTQIMHLEADIDKIKRDTGWQPKTTLEEGLRKTVSAHRS